MKAYSDIEQSKKLAKILPIESADMFYTSLNRDYPWIWIDKHLMEVDDIPCWSLAALLSVLPYPIIEQNYNGKWVCRTTHKNTTYLWEDYNPVDACYKMIEKLHTENLI